MPRNGAQQLAMQEHGAEQVLAVHCLLGIKRVADDNVARVQVSAEDHRMPCAPGRERLRARR